MRACNEEALNAGWEVGTGGRIGAALVRDGELFAVTHHEVFGGLHGERRLLAETLEGEEILPEDILVVNLEPCVPFPGKKTPPCTGIIKERGVRRVIYGMVDPDVGVAGNGLRELEDSRIEIFGPVDEDACRELNRGFISVRLNQRPFIGLGELSAPETTRLHYPALIGSAAEMMSGLSPFEQAIAEDLLGIFVVRSEADLEAVRSRAWTGPHVLVHPGEQPQHIQTNEHTAQITCTGSTLDEIVRALAKPHKETGFNGITSISALGNFADELNSAGLFDE